MRIDYLMYFLEVAESESFSQTAKKFYISHQGLSRAIHTLEQEFGVLLFDRVGKTITLNENGKIFAQSAQKILDEYESLKLNMLQILNSQLSYDGIRVATTPFLLHNSYKSMVASLDQFEQRNLIISELSRNEIIEEVLKAPDSNTAYIVDLPEYLLEEINKNAIYSFTPFFKTHIMMRTKRGTDYAQKDFFTKEEILKIPIAYYNEIALTDIISTMFGDINKLNTISKTTNLELIRKLVLDEKALAFTDSLSGFGQHNPAFIDIPIQNSIPISVGFIHNNHAQINKKCSLFIDFFKKSFSTENALYLKNYS